MRRLLVRPDTSRVRRSDSCGAPGCARALKGVFGSYVRHEQRPDSDLDVLVTFREAPSLLKFIELENYLSGVLGVKIDLVMEDALKPHIGQHILNEAVAV